MRTVWNQKKLRQKELSYLLSFVQDGGQGAGDAQQDLQDFGQVHVDEVAQLVQDNVDDVQQAVLTAQRKDGGHVCVSYGFFHRFQAGS